MIGTAEFIYNKDVNGVYYFNANLPAAADDIRRRRQPPALDRDILRDARRLVRAPRGSTTPPATSSPARSC